MPIFQTSNATFWVIFKQCESRLATLRVVSSELLSLSLSSPQPFSCPFLSMWKGHIRRLYWLARYAWSFIRSFLGLLLLVSQWSHGIYHQNHGISRIKLWMVPSRFEYICPSLFYSLYIFHLLTASSRSCYNNRSKNSTQLLDVQGRFLEIITQPF